MVTWNDDSGQSNDGSDGERTDVVSPVRAGDLISQLINSSDMFISNLCQTAFSLQSTNMYNSCQVPSLSRILLSSSCFICRR
jgi:hypothetical protein